VHLVGFYCKKTRNINKCASKVTGSAGLESICNEGLRNKAYILTVKQQRYVCLCASQKGI